MPNKERDRKNVDEARAWVRSVAAFAAFLRFGNPSYGPIRSQIEEAYGIADRFLARLEKDLDAQ